MDKTEKSNEGNNVRVAIRIRPLNEREKKDGYSWGWGPKEIWQIVNGRYMNKFSFDNIYGCDSSSQHIYGHEVAKPIVQSAMNGINGTVFAYGQTSSGKTHTIKGSQEQPGIIPLAINDVFNSIRDNPNNEYLLRVSYFEIYNEVINDLLQSNAGANLKIREDIERGIFVDELREEIVLSADHAMELLDEGEKRRHVGATNMNARSSRSHTLFRMVIESKPKGDADAQASVVGGPAPMPGTEDANINADAGGVVRVSTLTLVDLAGSERASTAGTEGKRFKEGAHINKSLHALSNVIKKLSEGQNGHIPYRDSKLTRILQPSLGGNSITSIVCAVTPAMCHSYETLSTLQFAQKAKFIRNKPHVNEVVDDKAMLKRYKQEITTLRRQLHEVSDGDSRAKALRKLQKEKDKMVSDREALETKLSEHESARNAQKDKIQRLMNLILSSDTLPLAGVRPGITRSDRGVDGSNRSVACDDESEISGDGCSARSKSRRETWAPGMAVSLGFLPAGFDVGNGDPSVGVKGKGKGKSNGKSMISSAESMNISGESKVNGGVIGRGSLDPRMLSKGNATNTNTNMAMNMNTDHEALWRAAFDKEKEEVGRAHQMLGNTQHSLEEEIRKRQELEAKLEESAQQMEKAESRIDALEKDLVSEKEEKQKAVIAAQHSAAAKAMEKELAVKTRELERLTSRVQAAEAKVKQAAQDRNSAIAERATTDREIKRLRAQNTLLEKDSKKAEDSVKSALAKAKEATAALSSVEKRATDLQRQVESSSGRVAALATVEAALEKTQARVAELELLLEESQNEHIAAANEAEAAAEAAVKHLQAEEEASNIISEMSEEMTRLKQELETTQSRINDLEMDKADLEGRSEAAESTADKIPALESTISDLEMKLAEEKERAYAAECRVTDLEDELGDNKKAMGEAHSEIAELKLHVESLEETIEAVEADKNELESKIDTACSDAVDRALSSEEKAAELEAKVAELYAEKDTILTEKQSLETTLTESNAKIASLEDELKANEELKREHEGCSEKFRLMEGRVSDAVEVAVEARQERVTVTEENRVLKKNLAKLEREVKDMASSLEAAENDSMESREQVVQLRGELTRMEKEKEEKEKSAAPESAKQDMDMVDGQRVREKERELNELNTKMEEYRRKGHRMQRMLLAVKEKMADPIAFDQACDMARLQDDIQYERKKRMQQNHTIEALESEIQQLKKQQQNQLVARQFGKENANVV